MRKIELLAISLMALLLVACQSRPDYVIDEDTMTELLTDVHMAEGLIDVQERHNRKDNEYGQRVMAAVFMKHNVSKASYDTSLVWYSQHLNTLIRIYKHVNENLKANERHWIALAEASDDFGKSLAGDSVNLWRQPPYVVMDEARMTHFRTWVVPADSNFMVGDTIRWTLHIASLPEGEGLVASLALLSHDERKGNYDVHVGTSTALLMADTTLTLCCAGQSDKPFTHVNVALHLMRTSQLESRLLPCVVDSLKLIRIHPKKKE
jgi:uncharacterized protein YcfL